MKKQYGIDSMPETAENVAADFGIARADQDAFALRSQQRYFAAQARGFFAGEIAPVTVPGRKGDTVVAEDEHPRETTLEALAKLRPIVKPDGTVTAGNASGVNDGAVATLIASAAAVAKHGLKPIARIRGAATAGVPPRIMGIGPAPASEKLLARHGLKVTDIDVIELNEAFAAQVLACTREWQFTDSDFARMNVNGSGISLGHPVGATGGRILATLLREMQRRAVRYGLETMCIGGGQGLAAVFERV
jgi:acetyl-CoA acyltransferase